MSAQAHFNTHYGTHSTWRPASCTTAIDGGYSVTAQMPPSTHSSYPASNLTTMEAQHIFRLAAIEAENRSLVAQNQAKEKIIEFLLAQLVRANSTQSASVTTGHSLAAANPPATCLGVNSFNEGLLPDTSSGSVRHQTPLSPQLLMTNNGTLDDYWSALTPRSLSDVKDSRPIANPTERDLMDCIRPSVSHAAVPSHPGHPAMQAFAKSEVDHGFDDGLVSTQHMPETSAEVSVSVLRKSSFRTVDRPEMRAEALPFKPTSYTLQSMDSIQRPRSEHVNTNVAGNAASDKDEARSLLMYQPLQHDTDTQRTVVITGFPLNGKLSDFLSQVHTGLIYSVIVNDTSAISDRATVVLVFLRGEAARTFLSEATAKSMTVPDAHGVDHVLHVRMLESATYPIPGWLYRRITEQGATRVIRISGLPAELTCQAFTAFVCECGTRRHGLVSVCKDDNGSFTAEFTSISNALKAVDRLLSYPDFRNAVWSHLPDPCDVGTSTTGGASETESEGSGSMTPELIHGQEMPGSKTSEEQGRSLDAEVSEVHKYEHNEELI